jgi:hypothetical protein
MPCKHYKEALIEAAASGFQPQGDLRAHVNACDSCRAAFEQEQSLFSSIDAGLQVTANAEMPPSLLPRVRARLQQESALSRSWLTNWLVLASAAGVLVTLSAVHAVWRTNVVQKPVETAGKTIVPPRVTLPAQKQNPAVLPPMKKNSVSQLHLAIAKNSRAHETLIRRKTMPEVLVPRDQEVLLAEYAEQWRFHKRAPLLAQDSDATILAPLQVAQIQIAELDVKLLADQKSQ